MSSEEAKAYGIVDKVIHKIVDVKGVKPEPVAIG
jgi:ATP-dependent protease ClpP protease subunit